MILYTMMSSKQVEAKDAPRIAHVNKMRGDKLTTPPAVCVCVCGGGGGIKPVLLVSLVAQTT